MITAYGRSTRILRPMALVFAILLSLCSGTFAQESETSPLLGADFSTDPADAAYLRADALVEAKCPAAIPPLATAKRSVDAAVKYHWSIEVSVGWYTKGYHAIANCAKGSKGVERAYYDAEAIWALLNVAATDDQSMKQLAEAKERTLFDEAYRLGKSDPLLISGLKSWSAEILL